MFENTRRINHDITSNELSLKVQVDPLLIEPDRQTIGIQTI